MRVPALFVLVGVAGCGAPPAPPAAASGAVPASLHARYAQCRHRQLDVAYCARVAQAEQRRFLSGRSGPEEYRTLADLPPLPPSFDGPVEAPETRP